jgi:hypothetical protein
MTHPMTPSETNLVTPRPAPIRSTPSSPTALHLLAAGLALCLAACSKPTDANAENFGAALNAYLAKRGDLCVAKSAWPIDVTEREIETDGRNAIQMPVLEKLGLAASAVVDVDVKDEDGVNHATKVRRYTLTEDGKKYYVTREAVQRDGSRVRKGDFCAARLSLDKVVDWSPAAQPKTASPAGAASAPAAERLVAVTYTYKADAAPWMNDPQAQKIFPVVAGVLRDAGTARLTETFRQTASGWVAVDL